MSDRSRPVACLDSGGLARACKRLSDGSSRIVGWGSGSVFEYFHELHPLPLAYIVDNDSSRWGQSRRGIDVVRPERLQDEDPAETLVIVYSGAWLDIMPDVSRLGDFSAVPASAVFADATARTRLMWAETLASKAAFSRVPSAENTIVVQGPVLQGVTERVLRVMRRLNPNDLIVLSTWCDTDPADLAEVAALADDVVQSEWPACRGIQNRNCQIVSARAGINRALEHGARSILKTRTDMAVMAAHVFARARHWQERIGRGGAQGSGMRGRLIVPSSFTRKFIFYHPSDMVMLGASEDMATYWAAPLDPRTGSLLSPEWMDLPLSQLSLSGNPTESYLGTQFCGTIGRPVLGTLADSWAFYRDLFAVVDNDWFDLLWFKNLVIPDSTLRSGVRQTISQGFWERLRANDADLARDLVEVDPGAVALRALTGMAG